MLIFCALQKCSKPSKGRDPKGLRTRIDHACPKGMRMDIIEITFMKKLNHHGHKNPWTHPQETYPYGVYRGGVENLAAQASESMSGPLCLPGLIK